MADENKEKKRTMADALGELVNNTPNGLKPQINSKAPLNSPALTGTPTAPTPAEGDNSTKLATTAFVNNTVNKITEGLLSFADEDLDTFVELITEFKKLRSAKATSIDFGMVKVGSNITVSEGVISLQKTDVTNALGYEPPQTAGSSISLLGTTGSSTTDGMTQSAITNALNDKLDKTAAATTYLTKSDASTTYLSKSTASSTYATKSELSGAGTTYSTGNASTAGITKLYTGTGSATDGTMTQNAITTALNNKADSSALSNKLDQSTWDNYFVPGSNSRLIALKTNPLILNKKNDSNIGATTDYVFITENNSGTQFLFKSDGIYIGTKKITN